MPDIIINKDFLSIKINDNTNNIPFSKKLNNEPFIFVPIYIRNNLNNNNESKINYISFYDVYK
jgi:hypothetical protein